MGHGLVCNHQVETLWCGLKGGQGGTTASRAACPRLTWLALSTKLCRADLLGLGDLRVYGVTHSPGYGGCTAGRFALEYWWRLPTRCLPRQFSTAIALCGTLLQRRPRR